MNTGTVQLSAAPINEVRRKARLVSTGESYSIELYLRKKVATAAELGLQVT